VFSKKAFPVVARSVLATFFSGLLAWTTTVGEVRAAAPRPNIVVILSDDMGFYDIGCYGSEIQTPNLDRLAGNGIRFTQFYNTARCCPTRASLLTGLYPHQPGIGHMMQDSGYPGYRGELNERCVTIAGALKPAGYSSYAVGKWHVTRAVRPKSEAERANWPLQRGFDRFYGTITGAGSFFDPATLVQDNTLISPFADRGYPGNDDYYTDAISDHAARFIREHDKSKPFFLYVAYTAAHWPMHARERDIAMYKGRYAEGYEAVRKARYRKMLKEGVVTEKNSGLSLFLDNVGVTGEFWDWEQRNMEVFAAMVDSMDQGIGRIVQALEDAGQSSNTLFCYLQDNGGCAEALGRQALKKDGTAVQVVRAEKPAFPLIPAEALADGALKQTRDGFPIRQGRGVMVGGADTFSAPRDDTARASCGNGAKSIFLSLLEEGRLTEIDTKTGRAVLAFEADRQRVIESFRQADNRYFLQHCLQEILKRQLKVEVTAVESLTPELVPAV
jgi:hypothetical protein